MEDAWSGIGTTAVSFLAGVLAGFIMERHIYRRNGVRELAVELGRILGRYVARAELAIAAGEDVRRAFATEFALDLRAAIENLAVRLSDRKARRFLAMAETCYQLQDYERDQQLAVARARALHRFALKL
jgi:hypothetical protein